jgi:hypothetical protein
LQRSGACKFQHSTARSPYSRALVQLRSSSSASNRLSDNNSALFHRPNDLVLSRLHRRHPNDVRNSPPSCAALPFFRRAAHAT